MKLREVSYGTGRFLIGEGIWDIYIGGLNQGWLSESNNYFKYFFSKDWRIFVTCEIKIIDISNGIKNELI